MLTEEMDEARPSVRCVHRLEARVTVAHERKSIVRVHMHDIAVALPDRLDRLSSDVLVLACE